MAGNKKMSKARILALSISVILHGALVYYLGSMALDYALPEGEVTSYEMDFSKGNQLDTTEVDVIEASAPIKPTSPIPPAPVAKAPAPAPKTAPIILPKKSVIEEEIPDHQGSVPVATDISEPESLQNDSVKEDLLKENLDTVEDSNEKSQSDIVENDGPEDLPQVEEVAAPVVATMPAVSAAQPGAQTNQPFGTPEGIQSDTVLVPYGSNRPISYPNMARLRKIEGICIVHYTVSAEGAVTDIKVSQSSGHAILDSAAISAIKYWKFKPTGREGVYERPVRFQLAGNPKEAPAKLRRTN